MRFHSVFVLVSLMQATVSMPVPGLDDLAGKTAEAAQNPSASTITPVVAGGLVGAYGLSRSGLSSAEKNGQTRKEHGEHIKEVGVQHGVDSLITTGQGHITGGRNTQTKAATSTGLNPINAAKTFQESNAGLRQSTEDANTADNVANSTPRCKRDGTDCGGRGGRGRRGGQPARNAQKPALAVSTNLRHKSYADAVKHNLPKAPNTPNTPTALTTPTAPKLPKVASSRTVQTNSKSLNASPKKAPTFKNVNGSKP